MYLFTSLKERSGKGEEGIFPTDGGRPGPRVDDEFCRFN